MVTWGENTVHTYGAGSSAAPTFGAQPSAPPTTPAFGSSPAPGAPPAFSFAASSPGQTSLFGSTAGSALNRVTPNPSGGLFGNQTTGTSGGLFGSSTSPASGGLFGSSTFGGTGLASSSTGGLFGSQPSSFSAANPAMQQQQNPQIPAQAALQAHMDASARQEEARVQAAMQKVYSAYTGTAQATEEKSALFCTILYNPATPEMRQQQWLHGMGVDGRPRPVAPPKPPQVSDQDWSQAVVRNPDVQEYMPVALVGAENLQARLMGQQEQADTLAKQVDEIRQTQEVIRKRKEDAQKQLEEMARRRSIQRKQLLNVMRKVELVRCFNNPLQPDEMEAMQRINQIFLQVRQLTAHFNDLEDRARTAPVRPVQVTGVPDQRQLFEVLKENQSRLASLTDTVKKDMKDLKLISDRVDSVNASSPAHFYPR